MNARRAVIRLTFSGVDISADINKHLLSLTYTDNEEDKTDDLQLSLDDKEGVWLGSWLNTPTASKGAEISAVIVQKNWESDGKDRVLDCGVFAVDTVDGSGPPAKATIKAGSIPYASTIRTQKKTKAWEKYTLSGIAKEIAGANGFTRIFSGVGGVATRAFTGVAGTITGILGRAGAAVAAGPLGKIGSVVAKGFGKLSTLFGPLQKLGGAILGPFSGILGKVLPVVGVITLIISAVQILRDNLDKVREVIRNVFGDAGVEVFDKIVSAISNIGSTIQSIFTDGNLGGARDFLINLFGEEATGVIDGAITVLQTVWNILSGFIEFVNTYVRPIVEQIFTFIVQTVLPQIAQAFADWAPTIASILQGLATVVSTIATAIMSVIQFLMPTIQNIISVALTTIQGVVSGALTAIKGIVDVFAGIFTGDWSRVWEGVKGIFSGVWNSLKSIASGVLNGIIGLINGVISGLNKLKIPDWVPGIGGKGINIPLIPTFAKGTKNTPDTFIAGEAGAELVTNARNRTVFNAAETGAIFRNLANTVNTIRAGVGVPALQLAYAGAEAPSVSAPSIASGARQASIVIHSAPVFHVGSEAQAEDIEELLRRHDEELLDEIEERKRQQEDDERRRNYD